MGEVAKHPVTCEVNATKSLSLLADVILYVQILSDRLSPDLFGGCTTNRRPSGPFLPCLLFIHLPFYSSFYACRYRPKPSSRLPR